MLINLRNYTTEPIVILNEIIDSGKHIQFKVPQQVRVNELINTMTPKEIDVLTCAIALIERPNKPDYRERLNYGKKEAKEEDAEGDKEGDDEIEVEVFWKDEAQLQVFYAENTNAYYLDKGNNKLINANAELHWLFN